MCVCVFGFLLVSLQSVQNLPALAVAPPVRAHTVAAPAPVRAHAPPGVPSSSTEKSVTDPAFSRFLCELDKIF
jgi:hypothetical protein